MRKLALGLGLASVAATPAIAQQESDQADAAANWQAVEQCAQLSVEGARHSCIDQVLRDAGLLTSEREIAEQEESFGQQAVQREAEVENAVPQAAAPEDVTSVSSTIAFARFVGRERLLIVTESGAVWRQTSAESHRRLPSVGNDFEVTQASMGGFRCKIGRSTIYRCERLD